MTQEQKTIEQLYASDIDDNTSGDTKNENIRNVVETLRPRFAEISLSGAPVSTDIVSVGVFTKLSGTTVLTADPVPYQFTMPASNRLTYGGQAKCLASIRANVSLLLDSGINQEVAVRVAKNGVVVAESDAAEVLSGTTNIEHLHADALLSLVPTDYVEIWVANNTGSNDLTAQRLHMIVETKAIES